MSLRSKHIQPGQQEGTRGSGLTKTLFLGVPAEEQKPKLCSRCQRPVVLAYRVYSRELDRRTGEMRVAKGQFEVAHIMDGNPVFDVCPYPSLLDKLKQEIEREQNVTGSAVGPGKATVHLEEVVKKRDGSGEYSRVTCGARGNLWTTLDRRNVTCSNCRVKIEHDTRQLNQEIGETSMAMTADQIKAKIAESKNKKATAGTAGTAGTSAALVEKDEEGNPIPQATGKVSKKAVGTAKVEKGPKLLNACGCGCEQPTRTSSGKFIPGHDAKLHGLIKKLKEGKARLTEAPAQVQAGMYPKVKQAVVKAKNEKGEVVETLSGVEPSVEEAVYLESLKGLGGPATA
jgi:hypothetical protein